MLSIQSEHTPIYHIKSLTLLQAVLTIICLKKNPIQNQKLLRNEYHYNIFYKRALQKPLLRQDHLGFPLMNQVL